MSMIDVRQRLQPPSGVSSTYYSLPQLETKGLANISRLPVSVRILLESVPRHIDGRRIRDEDVEALVRWTPGATRIAEVPFVVGRVLLQDFTGVPLLVDLAAMRSAVARICHQVNLEFLARSVLEKDGVLYPDYTTVLDVDLADIEPSVAGPKRPPDRIAGPRRERSMRCWRAHLIHTSTGASMRTSPAGTRCGIRFRRAPAYLRAGGIMPYVLEQLLAEPQETAVS